jgi:hypothetical protein
MLFVGDDWAEDHRDVEIEGDAGRLARKRLPEGLAGITQLHALIAPARRPRTRRQQFRPDAFY